MIYVTHDQVEAMTLADRIVVLDFGTIAQVGTPKDLYRRPANLFVATFIGSPAMNILPCRTDTGHYRLDGGRGGPFAGARPAAKLGIRPEHVALAAPGEGACDAVVDVTEYLGADTYVIVDAGPLGRITLRSHGDDDIRPGTPVGLVFPPDQLHFFDASGLAIRDA
jgi:multiple sugar transport system ATP-binding protein